MNRTIATLLFLFSTVAVARPLITAEKQNGYEPKPETRLLTLHDNGRMVLEVHQIESGQTQRTLLSRFSPAAMSKFRDLVRGISEADKLIDLQPDLPLCADAASISISVRLSSGPKVIHNWASCHEFELTSGKDREVSQMMRYFLFL
ncbi:MAG: hypothetical protein AB7F86_18215 [Bdellovibrionales bacterium]